MANRRQELVMQLNCERTKLIRLYRHCNEFVTATALPELLNR